MRGCATCDAFNSLPARPVHLRHDLGHLDVIRTLSELVQGAGEELLRQGEHGGRGVLLVREAEPRMAARPRPESRQVHDGRPAQGSGGGGVENPISWGNRRPRDLRQWVPRAAKCPRWAGSRPPNPKNCLRKLRPCLPTTRERVPWAGPQPSEPTGQASEPDRQPSDPSTQPSEPSNQPTRG
jgi:hypothetical protein